VNDAAPARADNDDGKLRLKLWLRLLACSQTIEKDVRARLRTAHATTLPRFDVMAALERHPEGLTMGQLSRRLRVSNGNVTGVVERLVREGLVRRRQADGDRRSIRIALTGRGVTLFRRMAVEHQAWIDALLTGVDDDDIERATALLERVQDSAERAQKTGRTNHAHGRV
jgi:DNA-binding MarR family transcriptional regulator